MYKTTHQNRQNRVDRITMADMPSYQRERTPEEQYSDLKAAYKSLEARILKMEKGDMRDAVIRQRMAIQDQISILKRELRSGSYTLEQDLIDAAKAMVPKSLWGQIVAAARFAQQEREKSKSIDISDEIGDVLSENQSDDD